MIGVARIQAWSFRCPTPKPVATSFGIMCDRPAVLVRIEDHDGAFGWGEIWANWPAAGAEHRVGAGALAFDLADDVYDRDAFRAVFVKAAAAGPLPWPDQAFQRMPPPRSPSPSPPSSPVDDVSPPASPVAAPSPSASPPRSPATPASSRRAKTPKSARPPSSRQKTPQGSPEAAAPPSPEDDAPPSPEAQAPPSPAAEPEFAVGQKVEANFEGEGEWFAGVVDKVEDGRYDITYDDGDEEFGVEAARVRAATGDADVLAPLPAPQDELRRSDEYEESFEEEN